MKNTILFNLSITFLLITSIAYSQSEIEVKAFDAPNDSGNSITITWKSTSDDEVSYIIMRADEIDGDFKIVGRVVDGSDRYLDSKVKRNNSYYYKVQLKNEEGNIMESAIVGPVIPKAQWFNKTLIPTAVSIIIFAGIVIFFIYNAKSGKKQFIRRIPGLDAIDEAIGRATEMGKSILYVSGLGGIRSVPTIASLNILSQVARTAAEYDTPLYVPGNDPVIVNIAKEVVQNAHIDAGRPDTYRPENIFFVAEDQFPYAAAVDGIIIREKPAAIFYLGVFMAESLILAEVGNSIGSVQVAGTDSITQLPFFITSCDYTLMGEELYAASAYLSKDPLLLGSLKGQDWGKLLVIASIVIGVILQIIGFEWFTNLFRV